MRRLLLLVSISLALLAAPSLFACEECNDGLNCNFAPAPAFECIFYVEGYCANWGPCDWGAAPPLKAEYHVALVRVLEPAGKTAAPQLANGQVKPSSVVARADSIRR
jgi:hypothetical protein